MRRRSGAVCVTFAIVALAAGCRPGLPDTGFGDDGTVVVAGTAGAVTAAPARAGEVVVAVGEGELSRLAADGTVVDGWGGTLPVPCAERDEIDGDASGRYLLACTSTAPDGTRVTDVVRIAADGQPDPHFGTDGVVRLPGAIEGAAAVTLPGGRILALGGPPPAAGVTPVLVTTVLDHRGGLLSTDAQELAQVEAVPPDVRNGVAVTVVAEPTRHGAVVAVHASTLLTITDIFRPADPFLLLFDTAGNQTGRIEGPAVPPGAGYAHVLAMAELPGRRLAVLEEWWRISGSVRPFPESGRRVHVYTPDGVDEHVFVPEIPAEVAAPGHLLQAETLLVTDGGEHLLVGGVHPTGDWGWHGGVVRYDTATWTLDDEFGTAGLADLGELSVADLDLRSGRADRVDATGTAGPPLTPPQGPAAVTRIWNRPPPQG